MDFPILYAEPFGTTGVIKKTPQAEVSNEDSVELTFPLEANGIHQSDIIIRTAILAGIEDLRKNPQYLDYVFSSLPRDTQSANSYGQKSVDAAKEWFLKTDIPVSMVPRIDEGKWPRITISLADSQEFENTLGDVHYDPVEFIVDENWKPLSSRFTPTSYDPQLGEIVLPTSVTDNLIVVAGMYIVSKTGTAYKILTTDDTSIYITANTQADFKDAVIKGVKPSTAVHMESATFKETYHVGVHVGNEPVYLTWLHSIVVFILLRNRQVFLEGRGFERSSISSSDFIKNEQIDAELVFSRYVTVNGIVRHYWPKAIVPTVNGIVSGFRVNPAHKLPTGPDDVNVDKALWIGEQDEIDLDKDGIG